jgi:uncharacterized glyoxalase superfamily metalloenzyme YdcJ
MRLLHKILYNRQISTRFINQFSKVSSRSIFESNNDDNNKNQRDGKYYKSIFIGTSLTVLLAYKLLQKKCCEN